LRPWPSEDVKIHKDISPYNEGIISVLIKYSIFEYDTDDASPSSPLIPF